MHDEDTSAREDTMGNPQSSRTASPARVMDASGPGRCDHKFVDSAWCLKCGWNRSAIAEVDRLRSSNAELLDALKVTLNYWTSTGFAECEPDCECIVESVRAAIAKAEGH